MWITCNIAESSKFGAPAAMFGDCDDTTSVASSVVTNGALSVGSPSISDMSFDLWTTDSRCGVP